VLNTMRGRH